MNSLLFCSWIITNLYYIVHHLSSSIKICDIRNNHPEYTIFHLCFNFINFIEFWVEFKTSPIMSPTIFVLTFDLSSPCKKKPCSSLPIPGIHLHPLQAELLEQGCRSRPSIRLLRSRLLDPVTETGSPSLTLLASP